MVLGAEEVLPVSKVLAKPAAELEGEVVLADVVVEVVHRPVVAERPVVEARHEAEGSKESAEEAQQEAESNLVDAQGEIESLNNMVSDKEAEIVALNSTISELNPQLATVVELTGVSFDQITAQPAIDATVVRAVHDISPGLVALNRGSESGVKVGYTFEIYNGGQYKGQVRVENVRPNMCTALVTTAVSGTKIGQGDSAATRL